MFEGLDLIHYKPGRQGAPPDPEPATLFAVLIAGVVGFGCLGLVYLEHIAHVIHFTRGDSTIYVDAVVVGLILIWGRATQVTMADLSTWLIVWVQLWVFILVEGSLGFIVMLCSTAEGCTGTLGLIDGGVGLGLMTCVYTIIWLGTLREVMRRDVREWEEYDREIESMYD